MTGKGVKVIVRADSGFFSGVFFACREAKDAGYLVKVKMKNLVRHLSQQAWPAIPGHSGWVQTTFLHKCAEWYRARTFVVVRQFIRIEQGLFEIEWSYMPDPGIMFHWPTGVPKASWSKPALWY